MVTQQGVCKVLEIRMFGEFTIKYKEFDISDTINRSKRLRTMLAYLITHKGREVSQDDLIEVLWPDEEIENPANTLKTILHRVRAAIAQLGVENGQSFITYQRGAYSWAPTVPCFVDVHEFERLSTEAERCVADEERRAELYKSAAQLYRGDFLPKNSLDFWVVPLGSYYRSKFIKAVCEASDYLASNGRNEEVIPLCRNGINIDPYEEYFHLNLIRALIASGHQQQAIDHYDYVTDLFFNKFGVNPSHELTALYKDVVKSSKKTEVNLRVIIDDLKEDVVDSGCFYCEYEPFRTIYQLEARSAARSGTVVYVCLLTLSDARGNKPKQSVLNKSMDKLRTTIMLLLRHGDLFTRYSVNQYLVMLPTTSFETGNMVMRRISDAFRRENPKLPAVLSYTLHPIIPAALAQQSVLDA
jgi:DNA-binding SARP family transcriptional activator